MWAVATWHQVPPKTETNAKYEKMDNLLVVEISLLFWNK